MYLTRLSLTNFRNFEEFEYKFENPMTLVVGPNGSGKSNLLESVFLLMTTRSFRSRKDSELIFWSKDFARIEGVINSNEQVLPAHSSLSGSTERSPSNVLKAYPSESKTDGRGIKNKEVSSKNLVIVVQNSQKRLQVNGKTRSTYNFLGNFFTVLFSPQDLSLLTGSPKFRRRFLDQLTVMLDKKFFTILSTYHRVLRHRNKLLASGVIASEFEYWDKVLVENGARITARRVQIVTRLNDLLNSEGFHLIYFPFPKSVGEMKDLKEDDLISAISEVFAKKLNQLYEKERELRFTLVGPQRDDWRIERLRVKSKKLKVDLGIFGSRGEQRVAIVNLKLAQLDLLDKELGECPILLLDDIFSELDEENRTKLLRVFENQQTIITTTDIKNMARNLLSRCQTLDLT